MTEEKESNGEGIICFIKTTRTKEELQTTLEVLQEFKANESSDEWYATPFAAWAKLEQLEEFLKFLVNGEPLSGDSVDEAAKHNIDLESLCAGQGETNGFV